MEKICKWCSNYNKGKCTILNEKLYPDVPSSYWGTLDIITKFFDNHFRRFLDPNDLYDLADELSKILPTISKSPSRSERCSVIFS